jgi:hypothetical protein
MKTISVLTLLLFSALTFAQTTQPASVPNCYGNENVDQDKPFLFSVNGLDSIKAEALAQKIDQNEILIVGRMINLGQGFLLYDVGVDASKIAIAQVIGLDYNQAVNEMAYSEILSTVSKFQPDSSQVDIQCNQLADVLPKAGGVN